MTVRELEQRMDAQELAEWLELLALEQEDRARAERAGRR